MRKHFGRMVPLKVGRVGLTFDNCDWWFTEIEAVLPWIRRSDYHYKTKIK